MNVILMDIDEVNNLEQRDVEMVDAFEEECYGKSTYEEGGTAEEVANLDELDHRVVDYEPQNSSD